MNKSNIFLITIVAFTFFLLGSLFVGFEIYPYEHFHLFYSQLTNSKNIEFDKTILLNENEIFQLIELDNENIPFKKNLLIDYIWPNSDLPSTILPSNVETNISDSKYSDLKNLKQIDKILITMDHDVNSIAYLFLPINSNNELMIYHQGHSGDFFNGKNTIQKFLENGFPVLAFSMPLSGMNNQPIISSDDFGKVHLTSHNHFNLIDNSSFSSMRFFVEPVIISLNYISQNYDFQIYRMMGISGGGWTTIITSVLDDRIKHSYSIAGSIPMFLRTDPSDLGDYEQTNADFYKITNYLELYVLSAYGEDRRLIQLFNKYDPCCFSGNNYEVYVKILQDKLTELGSGYFSTYLDDTHFEHKISDKTTEFILEDIRSINQK